MKELSIEEKAKAYDEAKLRMSAAYNSNRCTIGFMNEIFPELKESEDEKVRKEIVTYLKSVIANKGYRDIIIESWIAWLEKQGEQKPTDYEKGHIQQNDFAPKSATEAANEEKVDNQNCIKSYAQEHIGDKIEPKFKVGDYIKPIDKCLGSPRIIEEVYDGWYVTDKGALYFEFEDNWELVENPVWSEEDERILQEVINNYDSAYLPPVMERERILKGLKSLKDRVQPQPEQEWSEEDDKKCDAIYSCIDSHYNGLAKDSLLIWLKSLRPQNTWKPSDEQMERLKGTINSLPHQEVLYSLYQDLKKLRGE